MKVGVDGVLIGSWSNPQGVEILDVGTGCGLIALMIAQRNNIAEIIGIDIDKDSVEEAKENVALSPWSDRIRIIEITFHDFINRETERNKKYDLIISNPPFFNSGIANPVTARETARHQASLSPLTLIKEGKKILSSKGRISLIAPADTLEKIKKVSEEERLQITGICFVSDHEGADNKRILVEISNNTNNKTVNEEKLVMFETDGNPTDKYRSLCKNFYLKF